MSRKAIIEIRNQETKRIPNGVLHLLSKNNLWWEPDRYPAGGWAIKSLSGVTTGIAHAHARAIICDMLFDEIRKDWPELGIQWSAESGNGIMQDWMVTVGLFKNMFFQEQTKLSVLIVAYSHCLEWKQNPEEYVKNRMGRR